MGRVDWAKDGAAQSVARANAAKITFMEEPSFANCRASVTGFEPNGKPVQSSFQSAHRLSSSLPARSAGVRPAKAPLELLLIGLTGKMSSEGFREPWPGISSPVQLAGQRSAHRLSSPVAEGLTGEDVC